MQYDVIIIGGGMVGATLAAVLKNSDVKVGLFDASPPSASSDERLIALNDASVSLFKNTGLWSRLAANATPIKQVHVSQRGYFGITRIDSSLVNLHALGYVVPAKYITAALEAHLKDANNITVGRPALLESLSQDEGTVQLTIRTENTLHHYKAPLVIGADGSASTVRALLNIPTKNIDYAQSALVTTTSLARDHHYIAYERFLDQGAIAMLPLNDRKVATIWTASNDIIASLLNLSDKDFISQLQKYFGYRLGRLESVGHRACYPLKMLKAESQHDRNVWLIGNAAHTIHPIAAQGLNLALYEVAVVATAILDKDLAIMNNITEQDFSQQLSHRLTWLFSSDMFILNQARQMGLLGLDLIPVLKKRFTIKAIGRGGFIPALLRRKDV